LARDGFSGFSPHTIRFLRDLSLHNDKTWFEQNRGDYEKYVLSPMRSLVTALSGPMLAIDPYLETSPSVGKTISRIFRDTRFSSDKSPFRSNVWMTFKRPAKRWQDAPAFFFEITPASNRYGMGFYSASKETMDRFRQSIDADPDKFRRAISFFAGPHPFMIEGDKYKRTLDPDKPNELLEWYQRKNLYLVCNRPIDDRLFQTSLADDLCEGFGTLAELYRYLLELRASGPGK